MSRLKYLRLSVTDRCNLRCRYCMPPEGIVNHGHQSTLSYEGYLEIVRALVPLGLEKVRITGGEPLVRKGIVGFVECLSQIPGIRVIAMTTNGVLLPQMAMDLKAAGLSRINLSLDAVDPETYQWIARTEDSTPALKGLEAALAAGLTPVKLNAVYMKGINDHQLEALMALTGPDVMLRLIELMPIGEAADWAQQHFAPVAAVLDAHPGLTRAPEMDSGVARYYRIRGTEASSDAESGRYVGAITPISNHFCDSCDKVRLTADGMLRTCLHSDHEVDLKPYLGLGDDGEALRAAVLQALGQKPSQHYLNQGQAPARRNMVTLGG